MFSWLSTLVLAGVLLWRSINTNYAPHVCLIAAVCHVALLFDSLIYFQLQQAVLNTIYVISYVGLLRLYWDTELKKAV